MGKNNPFRKALDGVRNDARTFVKDLLETMPDGSTDIRAAAILRDIPFFAGEGSPPTTIRRNDDGTFSVSFDGPDGTFVVRDEDLPTDDLVTLCAVTKQAKKLADEEKGAAQAQDTPDDPRWIHTAVVAYGQVLGFITGSVGTTGSVVMHKVLANRADPSIPISKNDDGDFIIPSGVVRPATTGDFLRFGANPAAYHDTDTDIYVIVREKANSKATLSYAAFSRVAARYARHLENHENAIDALAESLVVPSGKNRKPQPVIAPETAAAAWNAGGLPRQLVVRLAVLCHYTGRNVELQPGRTTKITKYHTDGYVEKIKDQMKSHL